MVQGSEIEGLEAGVGMRCQGSQMRGEGLGMKPVYLGNGELAFDSISGVGLTGGVHAHDV